MRKIDKKIGKIIRNQNSVLILLLSERKWGWCNIYQRIL